MRDWNVAGALVRSKGHNVKLVVSIFGSEHGLITIDRGNSDLSVVVGEVNLAESFDSM